MASIAKFDTWQNSAGTPRGTVLQTINSSVNTAGVTLDWACAPGVANLYGANTSNRTYTLATSISITPQSTTSKLFCIADIGWTSMTLVGTMAFGGIITLNDTSCINMSDYPYYQANNLLASGYQPATNISGMFSPNSTSTQTIRLRPFVYLESNTTTGRVNGYSLTVMEIQQ